MTTACTDAAREHCALEVLRSIVETEHQRLAATTYVLAAAALRVDPPADAGDEAGPDSVVSKPQTFHM